MSDHSRSIKCLAAIIVILGSSIGFGQQNSGPTIVVVDVGRVFKEHIRFNTQMNAMKERVKAFDTVVRGKQQQVEAMAQQAKKVGRETEQYKQLERQAAMYLQHKYSGKPLKEIGKIYEVGPSAISEASRRLLTRMKEDKPLLKAIQSVKGELGI